MIAAVRRGLTRGRQETLIAVAVMAAATWWGTTYWQLSLRAGREPQFYQQYFEPAVMIACGHGFVIAHPAPAPLVEFLQRTVNTFSCDQVAGNLDLSTQYLYQGAWRYLMYAVGLTWRLTGVAWTRLAPLFGVLFGLTIVAAYGIFRQGMGRALALVGAGLLSVSTVHVTNLPNLRDYAKAPFTLATVLILALLVTRPVRRAWVVGLCVAYGVVLGLGYGFRTDLLVNIPAVFVVLFLFLEGGIRRNLPTKLLGAVTFLLAFVITAWPILQFVNDKGGGQYHVALLGLTPDYDDALRIQPAPYDLVPIDQDMYIARTTMAYAARVHPELTNVAYLTHEYDLASGEYMRGIVSRFPADIMTRALASTVAVARMPFTWPGPPLKDFATWLYRPREIVLTALNRTGPLFVVAAVLAVSAYELRVGLFLVFVLFYFGGYPAIQFAPRHFFHLEFLGIGAMGLLLQGVIVRRRPPVGSLRRIALVCAVFAAVVASVFVFRLYQTTRARGLFAEYVSAAKTPIPSGPAQRDAAGFLPFAGPSKDAEVKFLEIDLDGAACSQPAGVDVRYDRRDPANNYSRRIAVAPQGLTRVFTPVYAPAFQGVQLPSGARCVSGVYWVEAAHRPLLLEVALGPDWERRGYYQRMHLEPGADTR